MEEEGISNVYIDHLMNKISSSFRGTFSIDNIPTFDDESFSLIVNLSKENEKGSHFIAISSSKNTRAARDPCPCGGQFNAGVCFLRLLNLHTVVVSSIPLYL